MTKKQKPELGDEIKDRVTKLQGVCTSRSVYLHGCAMLGVQPEVGKDGKIPEGYSIDEPQCVVVKKGKVDLGELPKEKMEADLGDEVLDPISGVKGTVTGRCDFLNGCTRMCVQPKLDKDGTMVTAEWFSGPRLKVTKKKSKPIPPPEKRPGGPMMKLPPRY